MQNIDQIICLLCAGVKKGQDGKWTSTGVEDEDFLDPKTGMSNYPGGQLRLQATYLLYKKAPDAVVFVPGGRGHDVPNDEPERPNLSEMLSQELQALGVPKSKIFIESRSNNTFEQLSALKYFLKVHGVAKVMIVTGKSHSKRVEAMVKHFPELNSLKAVATVYIAEEIILGDGNQFKADVQKLEANSKMKAIIAAEDKGIEQIEKGTYKYSI